MHQCMTKKDYGTDPTTAEVFMNKLWEHAAWLTLLAAGIIGGASFTVAKTVNYFFIPQESSICRSTQTTCSAENINPAQLPEKTTAQPLDISGTQVDMLKPLLGSNKPPFSCFLGRFADGKTVVVCQPTPLTFARNATIVFECIDTKQRSPKNHARNAKKVGCLGDGSVCFMREER